MEFADNIQQETSFINKKLINPNQTAPITSDLPFCGQKLSNEVKIPTQYWGTIGTGDLIETGTTYAGEGTWANSLAKVVLSERGEMGEELLIVYYSTLNEIRQSKLQLDSRTEEMCFKNNLTSYVRQIHEVIYNTYRRITFVEVDLMEDPETPDNEKICFEIQLTGEPTQILADEKKLYNIFFSKVPEEKQHFFTFTYRVL